MKEEIKIALEGYNQEKMALVNKLCELDSYKNMSTYGQLRDRLREIDESINLALRNLE